MVGAFWAYLQDGVTTRNWPLQRMGRRSCWRALDLVADVTLGARLRESKAAATKTKAASAGLHHRSQNRSAAMNDVFVKVSWMDSGREPPNVHPTRPSSKSCAPSAEAKRRCGHESKRGWTTELLLPPDGPPQRLAERSSWSAPTRAK